jgi:hypothetical protein
MFHFFLKGPRFSIQFSSEEYAATEGSDLMGRHLFDKFALPNGQHLVPVSDQLVPWRFLV